MIIAVAISFYFSSCGKNIQKEDAVKIVAEWTGKEIQFIFKQNGFSHPVFVDQTNEIGKLNNFPSRAEYQCFLLDKDNKVLMVGNPSLSPGIWTLYEKMINEREI